PILDSAQAEFPGSDPITLCTLLSATGSILRCEEYDQSCDVLEASAGRLSRPYKTGQDPRRSVECKRRRILPCFTRRLLSRSSPRLCRQGVRGAPSLKLRRDSLRSSLRRREKTGGKGIRTPDFQLAKLALYQLSYAPDESL